MALNSSARYLLIGAKRMKLNLRHIEPGKPNQNAYTYIERFNRTYREEVLNAYLFDSLDRVREITENWMRSYNEWRPYSSLGGLPPTVYREMLTADVSSYELSSLIGGST